MNFVQKHTFCAWSYIHSLHERLCSVICVVLCVCVYICICINEYELGLAERQCNVCLPIPAGFPLRNKAGVFWCFCVFVFVYLFVCVWVGLAERRCSVFLPIHAGFPLSNKADGSHFVNSRHPDINLSLEHQPTSLLELYKTIWRLDVGFWLCWRFTNKADGSHFVHLRHQSGSGASTSLLEWDHSHIISCLLIMLNAWVLNTPTTFPVHV